MKHDFSGKTAVVTGGSTGYGAGIAEVLSKSGASVWITGRHEETLGQTAEACSCRYVAADAAVEIERSHRALRLGHGG